MFKIHGNASSFNIENVLLRNIVNSEYYRSIQNLDDWNSIVDEIYYHVSDAEPWMSGNARGASTAFCLLYRLFSIQMTNRNVKNLLEHTDSPYIRAVRRITAICQKVHVRIGC